MMRRDKEREGRRREREREGRRRRDGKREREAGYIDIYILSVTLISS